MKVFAISADNKWYKIGEKISDSLWYGVGKEVAKFISSIKKGDVVEIKSTVGEDKKKYLSFIKKVGEDSSSVTITEVKPSGTTSTSSTTKSFYGKSPEEQNTIRRQAVGHMTSRTIVGLQGHVTLDNVLEVIDTLYKKYNDLTA
jgi:hypothetical protein